MEKILKVLNARQMVGKFAKGAMLAACFGMIMGMSGVASADTPAEVRNARGVLLGYVQISDDFDPDSAKLKLNEDITVRNTLDVTGLATFNGGIDAKENKIVNVAAGDITSASSTDAVNGGQLFTALQKKVDAGTAYGTKSVAVGAGATAGNEALSTKAGEATAVGNGAIAKQTGATAIGYGAKALQNYATALGNDAYANAFSSIALGVGATTTGDGSVSLGTYAYASGNYSVALGNDAYASGNYSVALGDRSVASEANTVSVGRVAEGTNAAIYRKIVNVENGSVAENSHDAVTGGQIYTMTNVESAGNYISAGTGVAGNLAALDTQVKANADALEGKADKATTLAGYGITDAYTKTETDTALGNKADKATTLAGYGITDAATKTELEGKADAATTLAGYGITDAYTKTEIDDAIAKIETSSKNSIAIGDKDKKSAKVGYENTVEGEKSTAVGYGNVVKGNGSGAFGDPNNVTGDGSYAFGNDNTINADNAFALGNNATVSAAGSVAIGAGSEATEANVVSVGKAGAERKIVNVKAGTEDTDAVNKKQLDDAVNSSTNKLMDKVNQTDDRVNRVGATAAALAAINYQPMAKGQSQVAVGMGGYKGKKATALGLAYQINDRVSGAIAGSANGSEHMFNVGFNYLFGQHSNKDVAQMAATPGSMSLKEAELQSEVDSQNAKISNLEAEIAELKAMVKALAASK